MALQKEGKDTTEIAVIIELQNQEGLGKPLLCTGFWRGVSADDGKTTIDNNCKRYCFKCIGKRVIVEFRFIGDI